MYSFSIALYAFVVKLISPFHRKARLMIKGQKQTFAVLKQSIDPKASYIWFHAASLGEFEQGRPVIEKIRKEYPHYKILLTFFSPSGYEACKKYDGADVVCYLPFDLPRKVEHFLDLTNPAIAIFIKYEFWMNYLIRLKKRNIPTYIISAIFRPDQIFFRSYADGYKKVLTYFNWFFVQDESSKKLLNEHGFSNVSVSGDTRFDRVYDICRQRRQLPVIEKFIHDNKSGKKVFTLVAGSSWPKDEDLFISWFNNQPDTKLIIAPHEIHKEHLDSIASKLKRPCVFYSRTTEENINSYDCLIVDSLGLLSSIYRYGNVAYIGGGFGVGIHNVLEAAVYGIPVVFGPNYRKFREARDLIDAGGGFSIDDETAFAALMSRFKTDTEALHLSGKKAGDYVKNNIGATNVILTSEYSLDLKTLIG